ncbi:helix-turn-helix domain-containing protein [Crocosphaera sp. Alani8]|uniref:helix-turn-helix domain-containing protein n=1 Tax=Crocosphaera sp. Alani8 TaxID=3038952 RepID=UPI00313AEBEC
MLVLTGMNLRQLRDKAKLKPEEAAYKIGVALSTLRNWEAGKHQPTMTISEFRNALSVYQCSLEDFDQAVKESVQAYKNEQILSKEK